MDNTKGHTSAFATFSPFKSRCSRFGEGLALFFAPINDVLAREPKFLHTAHFTRIKPAHLKRAGLKSQSLRYGALLFASEYNRDAETYFRGFNKQLHPVMNEVWRHCIEWRSAEDYPLLIEFIRKFQRRTDTFFCAYPDESKRIRATLLLRRQLDKLLTLARSNTATVDIDFERAFQRAVQLHWGNASTTKGDQ